MKDCPCPLCHDLFQFWGGDGDTTTVFRHLLKVHKRTEVEAAVLLADPEINGVGIPVLVINLLDLRDGRWVPK